MLPAVGDRIRLSPTAGSILLSKRLCLHAAYSHAEAVWARSVSMSHSLPLRSMLFGSRTVTRPAQIKRENPFPVSEGKNGSRRQQQNQQDRGGPSSASVRTGPNCLTVGLCRLHIRHLFRSLSLLHFG